MCFLKRTGESLNNKLTKKCIGEYKTLKFSERKFFKTLDIKATPSQEYGLVVRNVY